MKKLILILFGVSAYSYALAQANSSDKTRIMFDGGIDEVSVNNPAFNNWAKSNYSKNENPGISGMFDFAIAGKWDADLHLSAANPYLVTGLEFGKRITPGHFPIASYINLVYGRFDAMFNDLAPLNYTLTPDQKGQQMQLRSFNNYFGLTSRNYFSHFQFFIGKAHHAFFSSGFYITGGYLPFRKSWYYGYWETDGTDGDGNTSYAFQGSKVYNIPNINNFFVDAGVFIGIGF